MNGYTTPDDCTPQPMKEDDIWAAIEWLGTYEGDDDDGNPQQLANVMAYLKAEARRRNVEKIARKLQKEHPQFSAVRARNLASQHLSANGWN